MKRTLLFLVVATLLSFSVSSCSKCYTCDFGNDDIREFCSKDFPDKNDGLKLTIDAYEAQGYECTAK